MLCPSLEPVEIVRGDWPEFSLARLVYNPAAYAEFSFPFGLTAEGVTVKLAEPTAPELIFDTIKLSPHLSSLIGKPGACFEATIGHGRISGRNTRS